MKLERTTRRVLIGAALAVAAITWLIRELDLDGEQMLGFLTGSVVLVAAAAGAGILVVLSIKLVRRVRGRLRDQGRVHDQGSDSKNRSKRGA